MALTNVYIGTGGSDSNDGSTHALRKLTFNNGSNNGLLDEANMPSSGGIRINVNDEGSIVLTESFDITTAFLNSNSIGSNNRFHVQGYTSTANDGGRGDISGGGSFSIINQTAQDFVAFQDCKLHNSGSARLVQLDDDCGVINCELTDCAATCVEMDGRSTIVGNYFHDIDGVALNFQSGLCYRNRFIDDGASNDFTGAIQVTAAGACVLENIIWLDTVGAYGINYDTGSIVNGNSVFQNTLGTNGGIENRSASSRAISVSNNIVEGFDGVNGIGISVATTSQAVMLAGNAVFDCTDEYVGDDNGQAIISFDNEVLSASAFTDGANDDFTPVDTGGVKEGSQPEKIGLF